MEIPIADKKPQLHFITLFRTDAKRKCTIRFDDDSLAEALQTVIDWAEDPEMDFDWDDAALFAREMRKIEAKMLRHAHEQGILEVC